MGMRDDVQRYHDGFLGWGPRAYDSWVKLLERWKQTPGGMLVQKDGRTKDGLPIRWSAIMRLDGSVVTSRDDGIDIEGEDGDGWLDIGWPCPPFCGGDG